MRKKFYIILTSVVVLVFIIVGVRHYNFEHTVEIVPEASWKNHYFDVDSLVKASDIIIEGKVIGATLEQRYDLIFTMQEIEAEKVYIGDLKEGETVTVLQTGGELNGIETKAFREAPLLDKGDDYLLFLEYSDEGHYLILGGYQGVGKIKNGRVTFSNVRNDEISAVLSGKSLSYVNDILMEQTEYISASE